MPSTPSLPPMLRALATGLPVLLLPLFPACTLPWFTWPDDSSPPVVTAVVDPGIEAAGVSDLPLPGDISDVAPLEQAMLMAINRDRLNAGLSPLAWDALAAQSGRRHVLEMSRAGYMGHWDLKGYGPEYRNNRVGGYAAVAENLFNVTHLVDGRPEPHADFFQALHQAEQSLMKSPGHRANILMDEHTHVGVGFAHNAKTGQFYVAQEFTNHYVTLEPLPARAHVGDVVRVAGKLLPGAVEPNINLAWKPIPKPLTPQQLNRLGTYENDAHMFEPLDVTLEDGAFEQRVVLNYEQQPGVYDIRVWVLVKGHDVLAAEWLIEVSAPPPAAVVPGAR